MNGYDDPAQDRGGQVGADDSPVVTATRDEPAGRVAWRHALFGLALTVLLVALLAVKGVLS